MLKNLIFLGFLCLTSSSFCQFENASKDYKIFAQAMFSIPTEQEMLALEADIRQHPNVILARLDFQNQRVLLFTKDLDALTESDFISWFGNYSSTVRCIQIGVKGIDTMHPFPFTNCN